MTTTTHSNLIEYIEGFLKSLKKLTDTERDDSYKTEMASTIRVLNSRILTLPEKLKRLRENVDSDDSINDELNDIIGCVFIAYFKLNDRSIDEVTEFLNCDDAKIVYFARIIRNSQNHFLDPDIDHWSFDCYDACAYILRATLEESTNDDAVSFCRQALLGHTQVTHHKILTKLKKTEIYYEKVIPKILKYLLLEMEYQCDKFERKLVDNQKKRKR